MGKYKNNVINKYELLSDEELLIALKIELIENMKYFNAVDFIKNVFNKLNEAGFNLNEDFRKITTSECTDLIYYAYLRKIIPKEFSGSKKTVKILMEQLQIESLSPDRKDFEKIIMEQFLKDITKRGLLDINNIYESYYEDERLYIDTDLEGRKLEKEIEYKKMLYDRIKSKYDEALDIIIKSYNRKGNKVLIRKRTKQNN